MFGFPRFFSSPSVLEIKLWKLYRAAKVIFLVCFVNGSLMQKNILKPPNFYPEGKSMQQSHFWKLSYNATVEPVCEPSAGLCQHT